jgi:hypothetical protein
MGACWHEAERATSRAAQWILRCDRIALAAILGLVSGACAPSAREAADAVTAALGRGDVDAVLAHVARSYADPLGERATLEAELRALFAEQGTLPTRLAEVNLVRGEQPGRAELVGRIDVKTGGVPSFDLRGTLRWEFVEEDGRPRIRSGLLDDLRDVRALFAARRAALEANDVDALTALLDPTYRDGDTDREAAVVALRALIVGTPIRLEPTSYWIEVRGLEAHVDERYVLRAGDADQRAIGRFTLRRTAGRWRLSAGLLK